MSSVNRIESITHRAAVMLTVSLLFPLLLDDLKEVFYANAREARKTLLGPLSPKCSLLANIRAVLERRLPEDSYLVASGRLHISLTRVVDGQNVMVSEFSSNEELIQVKGSPLGVHRKTSTHSLGWRHRNIDDVLKRGVRKKGTDCSAGSVV